MALAGVVAALFFAAAQFDFASSSSLHGREEVPLDVRALPNSPSGGYAPKAVACPPTRPTIRGAGSGLSQSEQDFLTKRRAATVQPMADFFNRAGIVGFDARSYISNHKDNVSALPNIAIAVSGGGYRALMNGAGFLAAADSRSAGSMGKGGIGGLLQASTYLAGLSGGGWLVGSIYTNNFSSVDQLLDNSAVWQFQHNIFEGPSSGSGVGVVNTAQYWMDVRDQVEAKDNAGFETSVTDFWGRALSYQLVNAPDGGPNYSWSSIAQDPNLISGSIPMPILVADGRDPGTRILSLNATNFEMGPWEFGTFDPTVYAFAPTQYVGSNFSAGTVPQDGSCVEGFDNVGYVMGTSSSLFNAILTANLSQYANVPSFISTAISNLLSIAGEDNNDIAQWTPNPFMGFNPGSNPTANTQHLALVDGGEDLQNIPFNPLVQPQRAVDVIFAVDSSADTTTNWPNGTAMRASYERSLAAIANGTRFPVVPDANTFVNLGLNSRPTFFGCDVSNFTTTTKSNTTAAAAAAAAVIPPLVVYLPNAPYTTLSNVTTFEPTTTLVQRTSIIRNGFNSATQGNGTLDPAWPACMACAALSRSLARTGTPVPSACTACFARYCWNGTLDAAETGPFEPTFKIGSDGTSAGVRLMDAREARFRVAVGLIGAVALGALI